MNSTELQPPGNYPETWLRIDFDHFTTLKRGKDLTRDQFRRGSVPVAGSNGIIGTHDTANVVGPGVTVGRSGSVGRVTFYAEGFWAHNTALFVSDFHGNDQRFAAYLLDFLELGRFRSGVSVPTLDRNVFRLLPLVVPPLDEQRNIAAVLQFVQRAIKQQECLMALTAEFKKSLLHHLFTVGFHNEPQKQTDLGPIPQSWQVTTLGNVAKFQTGGTPSRTNPDYWVGGDIPWVKTAEINYNVIAQTEELITRNGLEDSAAKIFPSGTVVVAMYGQGVTRGRVGILGIDAATNQACAAITPYDEDRIASLFIYFFLEFHYEHLRQLGHGANQRNLNVALLKSFPLAFPTSDEQTEIVRILAILDSKLEVHQRKHATLSALFGTLLHELMTARIRIQKLDLALP